ncbi:VCBS repeat domain-containing M23 family metallopeptidase [Marmoricola sp. Leaf446]|uniref:VCBS repeat domain-containing M23 family metallopeptidase n=1 Tax=Marmoricola sp. Leaf446 TaxID=1736379 RepID=UPI00138EED76|nr:VCBS repeat domain-containing M23 family metallopeptidase [Marmoricola sp. Leaf446]
MSDPRRSRTAARRLLGLGLVTALALGSGLAATPAATGADGAGDTRAHGQGRMGPSSARTVSATPATGPDFEMPFPCGQTWTGSSRASHSPSSWTVDFNTPDDLGKPALAAAPGVVVLTRSLTTSYGRYVIVDHGGGYTTLYAHLNAIAATVGQVVDQGDLIGYVGTTGGSTGPHLHFEERRDGGYFAPWFARTRFVLGSTSASKSCGDRPLAGDFDGNGVDEPAVWRPAAASGRFYLRTQPTTQSLLWGKPGDTPLAGDFNGDGITQVGTKQLGRSTWQLRGGSGATATVTVGGIHDEPLAGDWDGNGLAELGWYRWSDRSFTLRAADHATTRVVWGLSGEQPVVGDWNGNRTTDVGAFRSSTATWRLRVASGTSYTTRTVTFGSPGDRPVVGDWNGDGTDDLGVWRPSTASFHLRVPEGAGFVTQVVPYGTPRG